MVIFIIILLMMINYFVLEKSTKNKEIEYRINRKMVIFLVTLIIPMIWGIIFYEVEYVNAPNDVIGAYGIIGIILYVILVNLIFIKRERISSTIEQINSSSEGILYHFINNPINLLEVCFKNIDKNSTQKEIFILKQERAYFSKTTRFIFIIFNISIVWINFIMLLVLLNFDSFIEKINLQNLIYSIKNIDFHMIIAVIFLSLFIHIFIGMLRAILLRVIKLVKVPQLFQYLIFWTIILGSLDGVVYLKFFR